MAHPYISHVLTKSTSHAAFTLVLSLHMLYYRKKSLCDDWMFKYFSLTVAPFPVSLSRTTNRLCISINQVQRTMYLSPYFTMPTFTWVSKAFVCSTSSSMWGAEVRILRITFNCPFYWKPLRHWSSNHILWQTRVQVILFNFVSIYKRRGMLKENLLHEIWRLSLLLF